MLHVLYYCTAVCAVLINCRYRFHRPGLVRLLLNLYIFPHLQTSLALFEWAYTAPVGHENLSRFIPVVLEALIELWIPCWVNPSKIRFRAPPPPNPPPLPPPPQKRTIGPDPKKVWTWSAGRTTLKQVTIYTYLSCDRQHTSICSTTFTPPSLLSLTENKTTHTQTPTHTRVRTHRHTWTQIHKIHTDTDTHYIHT